MSRLPRAIAILAALTLTVPLLGSSATARSAAPVPAPGPRPLPGLQSLGAAVADPVIGLLPAFPMPHVPYTGDTCPDGAAACIDATIERMRADLDRFAETCDHNVYNARLDRLYGPVFAEQAARFDPTFDAIDVGEVEETAASLILRGWREMVWRNAESLVLARTPHQRRLAEQFIETYAATQAVLMRLMFAAPSSTRRDAWCAEHGRG